MDTLEDPTLENPHSRIIQSPTSRQIYLPSLSLSHQPLTTLPSTTLSPPQRKLAPTHGHRNGNSSGHVLLHGDAPPGSAFWVGAGPGPIRVRAEEEGRAQEGVEGLGHREAVVVPRREVTRMA